MNIGIIGYGNVSKEVIRLIQKNTDFIIKYIIKSDGGIYLDEEILTGEDIKVHKNWNEELTYKNVVNDKTIDLVIELTNTNVETGEPALTHITESLQNGKHVVTGNKGPILHKYHLLKAIACKNKVELGIGCTVGGALPTFIIGTKGINGSNIKSIEGVLNGTSNYILDLMHNNGISYKEALQKAKKEGIAEKDPTLDVCGYDSATKIIILVNTILNLNIKLKDISIKGIDSITIDDIQNAKLNNGAIKLIAKYKDNTISVSPEFVGKDNILYSITSKNKGVKIDTDLLGDIFISGGESSVTGAAASILRDILNICSL